MIAFIITLALTLYMTGMIWSICNSKIYNPDSRYLLDNYINLWYFFSREMSLTLFLVVLPLSAIPFYK